MALYPLLDVSQLLFPRISSLLELLQPDLMRFDEFIQIFFQFSERINSLLQCLGQSRINNWTIWSYFDQVKRAAIIPIAVCSDSFQSWSRIGGEARIGYFHGCTSDSHVFGCRPNVGIRSVHNATSYCAARTISVALEHVVLHHLAHIWNL